MRSAFDLDGVMADFANPCNQWLADFLGREPIPILQWDWFDLYGEGGSDAFKHFWNYCQESEFFLTLDPLPNAVESVQNLWREGTDITFVTARNERLYGDQTREWLRLHGLGEIPVLFSRDKASLGFDLYLDDKPDILADALDIAATAICFLHPYNAYWAHHACALVARSWAEAERLIREERLVHPYRVKGVL